MTSPRERLIFVRYAFPCASEKLKAGKISQEMHDELERSAMNNIPPSADLLKRCFSKGFSRFEADLNFMSAEESWRRHGGSSENCATKTGFVSSFPGEGLVELSLEGESKMFRAINLYKLHLEVGDKVFVHRGVIADVD